MECNSEPAEKVTVASDQQPAKQDSPRNAIDDGISIVLRFVQCQNAEAPMEATRESRPNFTEQIDWQPSKQYSPIPSISSAIVTACSLPQ
jgi:hypothetical protein